MHCFKEGERVDRVHAAVGTEAVTGSGRLWQPGPLLVFTRGGAVIEAV